MWQRRLGHQTNPSRLDIERGKSTVAPRKHSKLPSVTIAAAFAAALVVGQLAAGVGTSEAATSQPCDIYAAGGTPCVAAHSTTRALYGTYGGPLYQVRRASDNTTRDIA